MKRAFVLALWFFACKTPVERTGVTGVRLTVSFDAALSVDQIIVVGRHANGDLLGVETLPEKAAGALSGTESVAILFSAPVDGEVIRLRIDGLSAGAVVTSGRGTVQTTLGSMQPVTIDLGAPAVCGDGVLQAALEQCDDGDAADGDGCDDECAIEAGAACLAGSPSVCSVGCGDGVTAGAEACDDGDNDDGDGCSKTCAVEAGYTCNGLRSTCTALCGNGKLDGSEACDDGDRDVGDGCDAACVKEPGYACSGEPSVCAFTCGDGDIDLGEQCDDHDLDTGDGCDASCQREVGWECDAAMPSVCHLSCGDSTIDAGEQCDDGNLTPTDGCDDSCQISAGYECDNATVPSQCNLICGNSTINVANGELCDGPTLPTGTTCWALGYRDGTPACSANCRAILTGGCGAKIDNVAALSAAIGEAIADDNPNDTPDVIGLHPAIYNLGGTPLVVDECPGSCGVGVDGVHLRPVFGVTGVVSISGTAAGIEVRSPNNVIEGLRFTTDGTALRATTNEATGNRFVNNEVVIPVGGGARKAMVSDGGASQTSFVGNWIHSDSTTSMDAAVYVDGTAARILLNVIYGRYTHTIDLNNANSGVTRIDNNSIYLPANSTGVALSNSTGICMRGNLISGANSVTIAYDLNSSTFGNAGTCGTQSTKNAVSGLTVRCTDSGSSECAATNCSPNVGSNGLCDILTSPGFSSLTEQQQQCLTLPAAAFVDQAPDLGYDYNGELAGRSNGTPDVGAHESPSSQTYGGTTITCP